MFQVLCTKHKYFFSPIHRASDDMFIHNISDDPSSVLQSARSCEFHPVSKVHLSLQQVSLDS